MSSGFASLNESTLSHLAPVFVPASRGVGMFKSSNRTRRSRGLDDTPPAAIYFLNLAAIPSRRLPLHLLKRDPR